MTTFASANTETWNYNAKGEAVRADHGTNMGTGHKYGDRAEWHGLKGTYRLFSS